MMSAKLGTLGFLETNFLKQRFLKVLNMPVKVFTSPQVPMWQVCFSEVQLRTEIMIHYMPY